MFRDLLVNQYIFHFRLKTNNKINVSYNGTAVGLLMMAAECLKRSREKMVFAFRLAAVCGVGNARTLATTANAVLMGDYTGAEIQFSLNLYCIFSPS